MDLRYLQIIMTNGENELKMGVGCPIKIVSMSGIESSEYSIHTTTSATEDGSSVTGKHVEARNINLVFGVDDFSNSVQHRRNLVRFFNPKNTIHLKINYCYSQVQINCEIASFKFSDQVTLWDILEGNLELLCPFPYFSDLDNFGKNIAAFTAQWAYPLTFSNVENDKHELHKIFGYKTFSNVAVLPNKGDVSTGVVIKLTATRGYVKNPIIKKESTNEFIEVFLEMEKGDVITIDTNSGKKEITYTHLGVTKKISNKINKQSTYFSINVGDNAIRYDAEVNYTNLDVHLYYTPKYLGV